MTSTFVLIDSRHGVKPVDEEIMSLLDTSAVPFQAVLTKADKIKTAEREKVLDQVRGKLAISQDQAAGTIDFALAALLRR